MISHQLQQVGLLPGTLVMQHRLMLEAVIFAGWHDSCMERTPFPHLARPADDLLGQHHEGDTTAYLEQTMLRHIAIACMSC